MNHQGMHNGGAVPAFLIVPVRENEAKLIRESADPLIWRKGNIPAFQHWEDAAAYSRKQWRKKVHFIILDGFALDDEQVRLRNENGRIWIDGNVHRRHALNLDRQTRRQISAGGVVRCATPKGVMLALIQVDRNGVRRWEIPKGKIRRKETAEQAAVREVREETGIDVSLRVGDPIGRVDYLFQARDDKLYFKTVHYYLLEASEEGALEPRAEEGIADARWFPDENACEIVSFANLKPILRRALVTGTGA